MSLPLTVIGLSNENWKKINTKSVERDHMVMTVNSYKFKEIVREDLADKRVFIRQCSIPDPLWKEKQTINPLCIHKIFCVRILRSLARFF